MLGRVLSFFAVFLLATACTDGRAYAYAHASGLKTPHLGFIALNVNPIQEKSPLSPSATKEKSLEIAAASIGRGNYLRARYMDPAAGRFVGMDQWHGDNWLPTSQNKFIWADGNPVMNVDPLGYFSMTELSAAQNIATRMILMSVREHGFNQISSSFVRGLIGALPSGPNINVPKTGSPGGVGLVTALAIMCRANSSRCLLKGIPTFISGSNTPVSSLHLVLAQFGNGTTSDQAPKPLPFLLTKRSQRRAVTGRRGKPGCTFAIGAAAAHCDEFPYASTDQGGNTNYNNGLVSLPGESGIQGSNLSRFYRRAVVQNGGPFSLFLAIGLPTHPTSYIDRTTGKWTRL